MSATLKFTDYLNNKKKLNVPTTLPIGNEPVMSTGNVTMPKYTDALNGSNFGNTKQQLPAGIQAVQLTEETPKYSDAIKPGFMPTPGYVEDPDAKPSNPVTPSNPGTTITEPLSFEEYILSLKSKADDQYKRDILNAQNTYDQSKSAYGTKAASLSNMGLTGSGYSDYLDSRAYGQMQADKNAAIRTRDETKLAADTRFMDYLNQQETNKTNMFNSLYDNAGNFSNADIDNLAAINGLSTEQVAALKAGRLERIKSSLDNGDYDKEGLDSLFDVSIPEEKALYDTYYNKLANNTSTVNFLDENDKLMPESKASDELDKVMSTLGADSEAYKTLKAKYDEMYNVTTKGVRYTGKEIGNRLKTEKKGDNFEVEIGEGENRTKYNVQNGGKVEEDDADSHVLAFASNGKVKDGEVFAWRGALYLRTGNDIIRVEKRSVTYAGQYNALKEVFGLK